MVFELRTSKSRFILKTSILRRKEEACSQNDIRSQLINYLNTHTVTDLVVSHSFFITAGIDDSFLGVPVDTWLNTLSFKHATRLVHNQACINDVAERGVALIQMFNATTKNEEQKQYMLQVVERHRRDFPA